MSLSAILKSGHLRINSTENRLEIEGFSSHIPYSDLSASSWGYVYEKYVGQILETEGYDVIYNGLEFGFLDKGIDLIAKKDSEMKLIQCKFNSKISKSKIEWILYKASKELLRYSENKNFKIVFVLIVNNKENSFSTSMSKGFRLTFTPTNKIEFPILQYFLDHNYIQDKVKLEFREIEMER